jgi:hypothetical protein
MYGSGGAGFQAWIFNVAKNFHQNMVKNPTHEGLHSL